MQIFLAKPNENAKILQNGDAEHGPKEESNEVTEEVPVKQLLGEDNKGFCEKDEEKTDL